MTYPDLWRSLTDIYGEGEAKAVVRYLLEVSFGLKAADIYSGGVENLSAAEKERLSAMIQRLQRSEPVQYVAGIADFCGRTFDVDGNVLIPRPETEELCQWVIDDHHQDNVDILDIGTGSGCIAITLALGIDQSRVTAWDISEGALSVAKRNAKNLKAEVDFVKVDALCPPCEKGKWNIIVSNPPYICNKEQTAMHSNVMDYEPHTALFVPDDSPLLFYQAIAKYAMAALKAGGALFFEINPIYANETTEMLADCGFSNIETRNDQFGKRRMTKAIRV